MHNAEAAVEPAFYDHEDQIAPRDRVAADWGADEVFASVPRRRFRGDHHGSARRPAPRRVGAPGLDDDQDVADRDAWLAEVEAELLSAAEPVEDVRPEDLTEGVELTGPAAWDAAPVEVEVGADGRRTVAITGRPERPAAVVPPQTDRRRPSRTLDERIGARPDRVAGLAFGMSLVLIAVAAIS
jgi:hypothetical protein